MDAGPHNVVATIAWHSGSRARASHAAAPTHMAQEIVAEEALLRLTRLCGINLVTLYGVVAAVGDVRRLVTVKS